jgi:hypothetical protein
MSEATKMFLERKNSVRLGRRFAGSIAVRLDAHPCSRDGARLEDERRLLSLMHEVLVQAAPEPSAVHFLTHSVELHTKTYGFSQRIYQELFKLHQARLTQRQW